jgi:ABC-2 type transport system permease protein
LTANLTVGFILGALFNLPLAAFGVADWFIKNPVWAEKVRRWGALKQFEDFQRGVISLGGVAYFVLVAVVMVYLSMVLIGRRHWQAREESNMLWGHYFIRALSLLAVAVGVTLLVQNRNWLRADVSWEQLSSLSPQSRQLLRELLAKDDLKPVKIDAYISPHVPTEFASTKFSLISTLEELRALGGGKIVVDRHEIPSYGPEAELAAKSFGITPREEAVMERGEIVTEDFFLGVAVTSGLDKVVTPFLNKGIPVEYELVRSIMTVSGNKRLRVGLVDTGLGIMGRSDGAREGEWPLAAELRKQYDLVSVNPAQVIKGRFDALLAIQPSLLEPTAFDNLVDAIRRGIPTAVLEDPLPYFYDESLPGTGQPKQSQMSMFGMGPPEPKAEVEQLWRLLGVEVDPMQVVFQNHSPEQSVKPYEDPQWIFIDKGNQAPEPFSKKNPVTSGLNQLLFLYPGAIKQADDSKLEFEQLAQTGVDNSGTVITMALRRFDGRTPSPNKRGLPWVRSKDGYVVAAHISGELPLDDAALDPALLDGEAAAADAADAAGAADKLPKQPKINAILVADIDCVVPSFFEIRESGNKKFLPVTQNVPFILNVVDYLAGDKRFLEIRKRAPLYRTLTEIDEATQESRKAASDQLEATTKEFESEADKAQEEMDKKIEAIENRTGLKELERQVQILQTQRQAQAELEAKAASLAEQQKRREREIAFERDQAIRTVQDLYKMYAILIPPIPPLLLAVAVFFRRRELERQGVARERLR